MGAGGLIAAWKLRPWCMPRLRVKAGSGFGVAAWEAHTGRDLPAGLSLVLQSFRLTEPQDVKDLAAVVPAGAVVFLDTLNRAAPTASAQDVRAVKLPQGGNQRLVLDALRPMFKDGATGTPGAPPLRPCIELEAAVTVGAGCLTFETWRRATRTRDAITGLVSKGVIGCNEGWVWLN